MKLIQSYGATTITTALTQEQFDKAQRYAPESLTIVKDKTPVFTVAFNPNGGSVSKHGIVFNQLTEAGNPFLTLGADGNAQLAPAENRREKIEADFGMVLYQLGQIEQQVTAKLSEIATTLATVADAIVIE